MNELEKAARQMPYPEPDLAPLHRRIRSATTLRAQRPAPWRRRLTLAAVPAAAALVLAGVVLLGRPHPAESAPSADFEALLASASAEVLSDAAAANYDDILYNQQL